MLRLKLFDALMDMSKFLLVLRKTIRAKWIIRSLTAAKFIIYTCISFMYVWKSGKNMPEFAVLESWTAKNGNNLGFGYFFLDCAIMRHQLSETINIFPQKWHEDVFLAFLILPRKDYTWYSQSAITKCDLIDNIRIWSSYWRATCHSKKDRSRTNSDCNQIPSMMLLCYSQKRNRLRLFKAPFHLSGVT